MLHVTAGDVVAEALRDAGVPGEILPWRDILYDGPAPEGLGPGELATVRAAYLADCGFAERAAAEAAFARRDARLARELSGGEVALWLGPSLNDVLQLLQILDRVAGIRGLAPVAPVTLISPPGEAARFDVLGPETLRGLLNGRRTVGAEELAVARLAWAAFRAPQPEAWLGLCAAPQQLCRLPGLPEAVARHMEEFPHPVTGLSRSERQILECLRQCELTPPELFAACQTREERPFMGDWSFWHILSGLAVSQLVTADCPLPPIPPHDGDVFLAQRLWLTPAGLEVLVGRRDRLTDWRGERWLGGVHLCPGHIWRYDPEACGICGGEE